MKKTISKTAVKRVRTSKVHLEFAHASARSVHVAGSFNNWHPAVTSMVPFSDGRWGKHLLLPPGIYEYRFVVDGEWVTDALAMETVPNPFGSFNSILQV